MHAPSSASDGSRSLVVRRLLRLAVACLVLLPWSLLPCSLLPGFVARAEAPAEPTGETFALRLAWEDSRSGKVIGKRTLVRRGQSRLEGRVEWPIRIDRASGKAGWTIKSGKPAIGPLKAGVPEDELNQMLIGRMYGPSGTVSREGRYTPADTLAEDVRALHQLLQQAAEGLVPPDQQRGFLRQGLSASIVETVTREHWKTLSESLHGLDLELGVKYVSEAPTDLPMGGSAVFASTLVLTSVNPCAGDPRSRCVRIESLSRPKTSLVEQVGDSVQALAGARPRRFDITTKMIHVVDAATLLPYSLTMVKDSDAEFLMEDGSVVPLKETATESWIYSWDR